MNFGFLGNIPWIGSLGAQSSKDLGGWLKPSSALLNPFSQWVSPDGSMWERFPLSVLHRVKKIQVTSTVNKDLKRNLRSRGVVETTTETTRIRFRPYVSKIPWHTGPRAFLSQLFPRYGHYCGPNWSSGKTGGSPIWDRRPIDWLDFCCYCHDIGYDTHDQAELLKADLAFLECLERPHMKAKGDAHVAHLYKTMCITGLRNILIPYRTHLLKVQSAQPMLGFGWLSNIKWKGWNPPQASLKP